MRWTPVFRALAAAALAAGSVACSAGITQNFGPDAEPEPATGSADDGTDNGAAGTPDGGIAEVCGNGLDDDGNGLVDDRCGCSIGDTQTCYIGATANACGGTQTCVGGSEFGAWGPCEGARAAEEEICEDGIDQDCDGEDAACERPTAVCDRSDRQTQVQVLRFASPLATLGRCPWNVGDNLSATSGGMRARHEVTQSIEPPAGAVVCSASFRVPQSNMYYDDAMYIVFNDIVVLSPSYWGAYLEQVDGLLIYEWLRLRGQGGGTLATYCPGAGSTCALPNTQQNGSISLELDEATQRALFDRAALAGTYDVMVAATGDNDPGSDCNHSAFDLEITYEYVMP